MTTLDAHLPYSGSAHPLWNEFPLGESFFHTGEEYIWDVKANPHILLYGRPGAGKSVAQRVLLNHCIQHSDKWEVYGVDLKRTELEEYRKNTDVVRKVISELDEAVDTLRTVRGMMLSRYEEMEFEGVRYFSDLKNKPKAILILVDELAPLTWEWETSAQPEKDNALKKEAQDLLIDIARNGRSAGIHLALATHQPATAVVHGALREAMTLRYGIGRTDAVVSNMILGSDSGTRTPEGKGVAAVYNTYTQETTYITGYFPKSLTNIVSSPYPRYMTKYPGSADHDWNRIPLGLHTDGGDDELIWDTLKVPHALFIGSAGSGKTVAQRVILSHCIQHYEHWEVYGIDMKGLDLPTYSKYDHVVKNVATDLQSAVELLQSLTDEMETRLARIHTESAWSFDVLTDPPKAIMLLVDEVAHLLQPNSIKKGKGEQLTEDRLKAKANYLLTGLAYLGSRAGVYVALATQTPGAVFHIVRQKLALNYVAGRVSNIVSEVVIGSDLGAQVDMEETTAVVDIQGGEIQYFIQGYFVDDNWIENWVAENPPSSRA